MSSVPTPERQAPVSVVTESDLTTKARIRQAAVVRFPIDGFAGTTVRGIATEAAVSPGLVIHHFGSKDNLRTECDNHVIRRLGELQRTSIAEGSYRSGDAVAAMYQLVEPEIRYLAWALGAGGATSDHIFDLLLADAVSQIIEYRDAGLVADVDDPRMLAAVILTMRLGSLLLHNQLSRTLSIDSLSAQGLMKLAPHVLSIFSGEVFDRRMMQDAASALAEFQQPTTAEKE